MEVEQENGEDSSAPPAVVTKTGVYAFVNGRVEFREAAIVHEGGDYYAVRPFTLLVWRWPIKWTLAPA